MKSKIGKAAKDIFAATTPTATTPTAPAGPGRPPVHDDAWTKVTVVLFNRQTDYLDDLIRDVRRAQRDQPRRIALTRAGLIRALVDALKDAQPTIDANGPALMLKLPVDRIELKPE
jgi:hypothetical protein